MEARRVFAFLRKLTLAYIVLMLLSSCGAAGSGGSVPGAEPVDRIGGDGTPIDTQKVIVGIGASPKSPGGRADLDATILTTKPPKATLPFSEDFSGISNLRDQLGLRFAVQAAEGTKITLVEESAPYLTLEDKSQINFVKLARKFEAVGLEDVGVVAHARSRLVPTAAEPHPSSAFYLTALNGRTLANLVCFRAQCVLQRYGTREFLGQVKGLDLSQWHDFALTVNLEARILQVSVDGAAPAISWEWPDDYESHYIDSEKNISLGIGGILFGSHVKSVGRIDLGKISVNKIENQ